jgi:hypothetical protein
MQQTEPLIKSSDNWQYVRYNMFNVNTASTNFLRWGLHSTTQQTLKFSTILVNEMPSAFIYSRFTHLLEQISTYIIIRLSYMQS